MTTPSASRAEAFRWHPPRAQVRQSGHRWGDWVAVLRQLSRQNQRRLRAELERLLAIKPRLEHLSNDELRAALASFKQSLRRRASGRVRADQDDLRAQALAHIALAAERCLGKAPYPVQLLAAVAMHEGYVLQMAAGEGKTIAVALVAVLCGWSGLPCHVVTANDYLAQRDVELMQPLFVFCDVEVKAIIPDSQPAELARCYAADVVYGTGKQLLADFLRDQISLQGAIDPLRRRIGVLQNDQASSQRMPVMRGLYWAVVDEADSVLIDEANTPLIISAAEPNPMMAEAVRAARKVALQLEPERDYWIDGMFREVRFTDEGLDRLASMAQSLPAVWHGEHRRKELVSQALTAQNLFELDRHYIVDEGKIVIVDENTGRAMPGRSWSYGLHQAIEAKEGVEISHPSKTMARMSFQEFFRRYHRLSGASGTLQGIGTELWWTYGLMTFPIPSRLPSQLRVLPCRHFVTREDKQLAFLDTIEHLHRLRFPILVGTRRISDSETLETLLRQRGLDCQVLNAKQLALEADIIAQAGAFGRITVATNMAGRGTDIAISSEVSVAGGLHVLMYEPHESARVDWQLFGRAGRQGAPGMAQPFACLQDDLIQRHTPWYLRSLLHLAERQASLRQLTFGLLLQAAQFNAQWRSWRQRKNLQQREEQMKKQLSFTDDFESQANGPAKGVA